ncbi:MAG: hypothetical protein OXH31_00990 [Gammaproteobacteria bacterium]|nr:hypothetical protein [Gammaproteobacteria bacterium]
MKRRLLVKVSFLLISACLWTAWGQEAPTDELIDSNAVDSRLNIPLVDRVYDHWIGKEKTISTALEVFSEIALDEDRKISERVNAHLTIAHFYWRYGDRDNALNSVESALSLEETTDGTLLKAQLLDADGKESDAAVWYQKTLETTELPEEQEFLQIRLTMIQVDRRNVDALVRLAVNRDQQFKNRAALVLAILGYPEDALVLYVPDSESEHYVSQLIRVAEWALKAEDYEIARMRAWQAFDEAEIRLDALYALTLVDEAYRRDEKMTDLVEELENRGTDNEILLDFRIDLLMNQSRFDDAIALYKELNQDMSDVNARQKLIGIYDIAGRSAEMVSEYEHQISREPNVVQWYHGLASHFINIAEQDRVLAVWDRFEVNNKERIDILVRGGEFMAQMGYVSEAVSMIERYEDAHGISTIGNMFLFDSHFNQGRGEEAEQVLDELREVLPLDSRDLLLVADSYERLHKYDKALDVYLSIRDQVDALSYDDLIRIARLWSLVGNKEEALKQWQEIWIAEETVARRNFAEGQLLQLAAEQNALARIAIEIETKLTNGSAKDFELDLLVRIYMEVGDSFSASEVVNEFASRSDMTEVERLRRLAPVYLQLSEYQKYDEVLRELEQIDPENRLEHIQNIVLNMLKFDTVQDPNELYSDIAYWLNQLRSYDSDAVSGEFEAAVLNTGGFSDEAIKSYRRAMIDQPDHSDNLLLMADLMKQNNLTDEAVTLLQYVAEHARDDNEFVVAIDGIINMEGQHTFVQRLPPETEAIFRWAHRVILERLTKQDDKFYLYRLLSDIALETNDHEGGFVALENSVSQAGIRRLAVLREIVTMATPNAGFSNLRNVKDVDRQLIFGRRLIGLRQQLPPDVYVNIARALLAQGDTLGAEMSLALVRDITGLMNVTKTKGDLFMAEAYSTHALTAYSQALAVNREDLELNSKTAILREVNGHFDVANVLYSSALAKLIRTLPIELPATQFQSSRSTSTLPRAYTTYYEILMQGLLSTWPHDEQTANSRLDLFLKLFDDEFNNVVPIVNQEAKLAEAGSEVTPSLSRFSRLDHTAQMLRRLCVAVDRDEHAEEIDFALASHFGNDVHFAETLRLHFWDNGIEPKPDLVERVQDLKFSAIPEDKSLVEFAFDSAIELQNIERVARLGTIVEPDESLYSVFLEHLEEGGFRSALNYASIVLNEREYSGLLNTVVTLLRETPKDLMNLLINDPAFIVEVEDQIGTPISTFDDSFWSNADVQIAFGTYYRSIPSLQSYFIQKNDFENLVALFERVVESLPTDGMSVLTIDVFTLHRKILSFPLNRKLVRRVEDTTMTLLSKAPLQDESARRVCDPMIFNFEVHPTNVDLFFQIVADVQEHSGISETEFTLLRDFYSGNKERAYQTLLDISSNDLSFGMYSRNLIFTPFKEQYLDSIQAIRDGRVDDVEYGRAILSKSRYFEANEIDDSERLNLQEKLVEKFPDNEDLLVLLISEYVETDELDKLVNFFRMLYELDKTEEFIRMSYFLIAVENGNYDQAVAVALDGGPNLLDKEKRDGIIARNEAVRVHGEFSPSFFLKLILNRNVSGSRYVVDDILPNDLKSMMTRLQEDASDELTKPEEIPQLLRTVWRGSHATTLGKITGSSYRVDNIQPVLLQWPSEGLLPREITYELYGARNRATTRGRPQTDSEAPTLIDVLVSKAPVGRELEQYLLSMPPSQRRWSFWHMYDLVSQAYQQHPETLTERLTELSESLVNDAVDDHEFTLWMKLVLDIESQLSNAESSAFMNRVRKVVSPTNDQLYMFSRMMLQLGHLEEAIDCFEMLLIGEVEYHEFQGSASDVFMRSFGNDRPGVLHMIEDLSEHLPQDSIKELIGRIVPLVRPFRNLPEFQHVWEAFAIRAFSVAYEPSAVVNKVEELIPGISDGVDIVRGFDEIRLIQLARVYSLAKDFKRANMIVRPMFTNKSIEVSGTLSESGAVSTLFVASTSDKMLAAIKNLGTNLGVTLPDISDTNRNSNTRRTSGGVFVSFVDEILDFDEPENVSSMVRALGSWLEDFDIDKHSIFQALASIARVHINRNESNQASEIAAIMQEWLLNQPDSDFDEQLVRTFSSLIPHVSQMIEPTVASIVCEHGLLDKSETLLLLKSLQENHTAEEVLKVAQTAYANDVDLPLLHEIHAIASVASDEQFLKASAAHIIDFEDAHKALRVAGALRETSKPE